MSLMIRDVSSAQLSNELGIQNMYLLKLSSHLFILQTATRLGLLHSGRIRSLSILLFTQNLRRCHESSTHLSNFVSS